MGESIKVKLHEGGYMPERHGVFCDLATRQEEKLEKGEVRIIPLGVSMLLPNGCWGLLVPRSSTCLKHGIMEANSIGVVEPDYCGDGDEWGFVAYAVRDTVIPAGTRICQFAAIPLMPDVEFEQVDATGQPDRGGYGSTGEQAANQKLLDADGVEIKVGDAVYYVSDRSFIPPTERLIVDKVETNLVHVEREGWLHPSHITHREPDSWEKLLADADKRDACAYFGGRPRRCIRCFDEENSACREAAIRDFLDRFKRLAGVE